MFHFRLVLICAAACAFGCGSPQQVDTTQADPQTFVEIIPAINVCPVFDRSLIIPVDISPSVAAEVVVKATDPDGNDATLSYSWAASSGSFSKPDRPTTTYRCAELGPQVLNVTAEDVRGCRSQLALAVKCIPE